jgi:hypothetical protein
MSLLNKNDIDNILETKDFDQIYDVVDNINLEDFDNYLNLEINKDGSYSNFLKNLNADEKEVIEKYQMSSRRLNEGNNFEILLSIFKKEVFPKLPCNIYCYRCYKENISINDIHNTKINKFLSVSLSRDYVKFFCTDDDAQPTQCYETPSKKNYLQICIIIQKGSKILPLMYEFFKTKMEYEIILPPGGKLIATQFCDPKYNLPIFIYSEENYEYTAGKKKKNKRTRNKNKRTRNKNKRTRNKKIIKLKISQKNNKIENIKKK